LESPGERIYFIQGINIHRVKRRREKKDTKRKWGGGIGQKKKMAMGSGGKQ